jgi:hypothetical protein
MPDRRGTLEIVRVVFVKCCKRKDAQKVQYRRYFAGGQGRVAGAGALCLGRLFLQTPQIQTLRENTHKRLMFPSVTDRANPARVWEMVTQKFYRLEIASGEFLHHSR